MSTTSNPSPVVTTTRDGYDQWASCYDTDGNPILALEQPHVDRLLGDVNGLSVLDVGCGTGRHAIRLAGAGAMQPRQLHRISFVRFDPVTAAVGNERRRHHRAVDLHAGEMPCDDKAGRPGFITHPQFDTGMRFLYFRYRLLQRVKAVGNASIIPDLAIAIRNSDSDALSVDIKSDVE